MALLRVTVRFASYGGGPQYAEVLEDIVSCSLDQGVLHVTDNQGRTDSFPIASLQSYSTEPMFKLESSD